MTLSILILIQTENRRSFLQMTNPILIYLPTFAYLTNPILIHLKLNVIMAADCKKTWSMIQCSLVYQIKLLINSSSQEILRLPQPILHGQLVRYFVLDSPISTRDAYLYASGLSMCASLSSMSNAPYSFMRQLYGMRIRVACTGLVYKKVS